MRPAGQRDSQGAAEEVNVALTAPRLGSVTRLGKEMRFKRAGCAARQRPERIDEGMIRTQRQHDRVDDTQPTPGGGAPEVSGQDMCGPGNGGGADGVFAPGMLGSNAANAGSRAPLPAEPRRIVHDFNNILTPILGYARLALNDAEPGSRLHADLTQILDAAGRARALIEEILAATPQKATATPGTEPHRPQTPRR